MTDVLTELASISRGFRFDYLDYAAVLAQLEAWRAAFPALVRLETIGTTPQGRPLVVAVIGREPERARPSVWVDGNMHATELCGSSVALAIAEDALAIAAGAVPESAQPLSRALRARLEDVVFHVLPRLSPDGAETVLKTGRYVRSVPRDERSDRRHARWIAGDVDGDGLALAMRVRDASGDYVAAADTPGIMLPRGIDDEGPFYRIYPEGHIENFDGVNIPAPTYLSDNDPDLNRNFPSAWLPAWEQIGAGRFALSEPESRAVVAYASARPWLFAWLNLHTFGGCFIRPAGDRRDEAMEPHDRAVFSDIGARCEEITGYPMVSGFEEFTYEPNQPLRGDLADWAYTQRGCVAYVCELWDLFARLGRARPKRFVDHYATLDAGDLRRLAAFDASDNRGRLFPPWRKVVHPQLGEVEVGGLDPRIGISNPPPELLPAICRAQAQAWFCTSALLPRVRIAGITQSALGPGVTRVVVVIENDGYLPTYGLASARKISWNEPLWAQASAEDGLALAGDARRELGHLSGWGRGRGPGSGLAWFVRSTGSGSRKQAEFVVTGRGRLVVRVGSARTGELAVEIDVR